MPPKYDPPLLPAPNYAGSEVIISAHMLSLCSFPVSLLLSILFLLILPPQTSVSDKYPHHDQASLLKEHFKVFKSVSIFSTNK